jgi:hypothetical protein
LKAVVRIFRERVSQRAEETARHDAFERIEGGEITIADREKHGELPGAAEKLLAKERLCKNNRCTEEIGPVIKGDT